MDWWVNDLVGIGLTLFLVLTGLGFLAGGLRKLGPHTVVNETRNRVHNQTWDISERIEMERMDQRLAEGRAAAAAIASAKVPAVNKPQETPRDASAIKPQPAKDKVKRR